MHAVYVHVYLYVSGTSNSLFMLTLRQRDLSAQQIANSGPEIMYRVVLQLLIEYLLMAVVGNETS